MKKVTLSSQEMRMASMHGAERYISARENNRNHTTVGDLSHARGSIDMLSTMSEMATAKALNLYWSGVEGINFPDVGGCFEVRSTTLKNGSLVVHVKDPDDQVIILTICDPPVFTLVGWTVAGKAKSRDDLIYKKEGGHFWMVPQSELENMDALKIKQAPSVGEDEWMFDL
jgi:hypothetical protein